MPSGRMTLSHPNPPHRPGFLRSGLAAEFALFRMPKVVLSALAIIFVPSLYVLIYVSSV